MKDKDIWKYSIFFMISVFLSVEIVLYELTGRGLIRRRNDKQVNVINKESCTALPRPTRPITTDDQLKLLTNYEEVCKSQFLESMMLFTNMPVSDEVAVKLADSMAGKLKEFDKFSVNPIIIVEPDSEWGLVDFNEFATGLYDGWTERYFKRLKENGITESQLGMVVPFPEPQQDFWNNNKDPDDFAKSINRYFAIVKKYYPNVNTGILLDSQVSEKDASQLIAYTRLIDPGLVNTVGLQGFPWHPSNEEDNRSPVTTAAKFVPAEMLMEAAESLDVKKVFVNTGTYRHRKADAGGNIAISSVERKDILNSIVHEVSILRKNNYDVAVNIFAENKLESKEGVNWSYWDNKNFDLANASHAGLFVDFVSKLSKEQARISIFDR